MNRQAGFTVLELLIASALGLTVILTAVTLLGTARQAQQVELAQQRWNENAQLATDLLRGALQRAGDPGCHPAARRNLIADGHDPAWPGVVTSATELELRAFRPVTRAHIMGGPATGAVIPLDRPHGIRPGSPVVVSTLDGEACVLFVHAGESDKALDRSAHAGAESSLNRVPETGYLPLDGEVIVFSLDQTRYAVASSVGAPTGRSLYQRRSSAAGRREELVVGVEALRVRAGMDPDGDGAIEGFVPGDAVPDGVAVGAVSVSLRISSGHRSAVASTVMTRPIDLTIALRNRRP